MTTVFIIVRSGNQVENFWGCALVCDCHVAKEMKTATKIPHDRIIDEVFELELDGVIAGLNDDAE